MENDSKKVLRNAWEVAFNNRDGSSFINLHSEDVTFHDPTFPKPIHGREELGGWFGDLFRMFPDCKMEVTKIYELGDWVCAECFESGTMKGAIRHPGGEIPPTGKRYRITNVLVCKVEAGEISEVRGFYDAIDLMGQLGLKP